MSHLYFWKTWKPSERYLYFFVLFFSGLAVGWYGYAWYTGTADVIETVLESEIHPKTIHLDTIDYQLFELPLDANAYYLTHFFRGSAMQINLMANYIYLFFVSLAFILLISVSTFLSRTWYVVLMALLMLYLVSINLELIQIWGKTDRTLLVIFLLSYLPLSYYFHSFENRISLLGRFLSFSAITSLIVFLIYKYAEITNPVLFFNGFGLAVPLVLSVMFIAANSYEILHGIFYVVTEASSASSRHSTLHFLVLSFIYILNLIYVFLYQIQVLDWGILYFSPFFLLLLTLILGIWGFKKRAILYQNIGAFAPYGAVLYLAMSILTFSTCAYAMATANDPLTEVFEDVITFTHLAFGIGFVLYAMANFYDYLSENKKAHRVIYMPHRLGFGFIFILGGLILGVLIFRTDNFTYRQAITSYYNAVGDIYRVEKDTLLMQKYYENSLASEYRNHKANYTMAHLMFDQKEKQRALMFFENALLKQPTEHSFLTLGRIYDHNESYFKSIDKFRKGLEKYPNSGKLASNLALLYKRMQLPDSTFIYFELARKNLQNEEQQIAEANFYSFWLKDNSGFATDSVLKIMNKATDVRKLNNEIVFRTSQNNRFHEPLNFSYLPDSVLQTIELSYLYNYALNQAPKGDTSLLKYLTHYENIPENQQNGFDAYLQLAQFFTFYYAQDYRNAYHKIDRLSRYEAQTNEYYTRILGTFLLQNQQFRRAGDAFKKSYLQGNIMAGVYAALAFSELENRVQALELWQELTTKGDSVNQKIARQMLGVLHSDSLSKINPINFKGKDLYYYVHFHHAQINAEQFENYAQKLSDNFLKIRLLLDRISFLIRNNQPQNASNLIQKLQIPEKAPKSLHDDFLFLELQVDYAQENLKDLDKKLSESNLKSEKLGYQTFYQGVIAEKSNPQEAEKRYQKALRQIPFEPQVVIRLANLYQNQQKSELAYQTLLKSLEVYPQIEHQPIQLLTAYAKQSAKMGYDNYVQEVLLELQTLMKVTDFQKLKKDILEIQAQYQASEIGF